MKKIILLSAVVTMLMTGCSTSSSTNEETQTTTMVSVDTTKLKAGETFYQCEMHPEVLSDKLGNCPKCGMELTKRIKK